MRKLKLLALSVLLMALPAVVQAQLTFTTNNGAITITGYTGNPIVLIIPSATNGYPVTSIGDQAFYYCTSLTSVTIPDSVTNIGIEAFDYCTSLTSVTIPNSLTSIGAFAFICCSSLTTVTIPNSVTIIEEYVLANCTSLTSVTIPNSVTSIGVCAIAGCYSLTSVMIPNSVTNIGDYAFDSCTSLTNVTIPDSVTSIGFLVFGDCYSLTAITVDPNNPSYSSVDGILFNKSTNTLIEFPGGIAGSYTPPNSVTYIGEYAFCDCSNLTSVMIPNSVTSIGEDAFYNCFSLSRVTIGNSVTNILDWAFGYCANLTGVYFKGNAPSIGLYSCAFYGDPATAYYLAGTTGWTNFSTITGLPIAEYFIPNLAIIAPTVGLRVRNASYRITGTATDKVAVTNVFYALNNSDWTSATTANNWTNWSAQVDIIPGTNTIAAYAVNTSGTFSTVSNVSFDFVVTNKLQIRASGLGTVSPNYSNAWLEIGRNYSITSSPASGFVATNWVVSTNWLGGVTTNNAVVRFMMASNLTLQINFADVAKPTNTITAPTAGQKMTNALATIVGTAKDNWKVTGVWFQLNNGAWNAPATTNGWTNWTTTLQLTIGTNTVKAYAMDLGGNFSTTNSVSVVSSNTFKLQLAFTNTEPLKINGLVFSLQLSTGLNGHIQVSTNLTSWTTLTNFIGTNTTLNFRDPAATNSSQRYYRAVVP